MSSLAHATPSRYSLHHTLADLGFPPLRVATAVEILMGPEPDENDEFVPSDADWDDYREFCSEIDSRWAEERIEDDARMDEYARWSEWQDALEAAHPPVRECDLHAAGLAI